MQTRNIYASRGGKNFTGYQAPSDAPIYNYTIKPNNISTYAMKDTGGQEWYLTDGGQWRNAATKSLSKTMPTYAAAVNTNPTVMGSPDPIQPVQNNANPEQTFKSVYEFIPKANEALFSPMPQRSLMDFVPKDWSGSPAYNNALNGE